MTDSKEISVQEILNKKEFSDFLKMATSYCKFIESVNNLTGIEFLKVAQSHLISLYSLGIQLPFVLMQSNKDFETTVDDNLMKTVLKSIGSRVPFSYYWTVLNPVDMNNEAETGTGDLTDDLADIYKDLKTSLLTFDVDNIAAKENAIWKFKFDFDEHWNEHAIEALSAIHHYLAENT